MGRWCRAGCRCRRSASSPAARRIRAPLTYDRLSEKRPREKKDAGSSHAVGLAHRGQGLVGRLVRQVGLRGGGSTAGDAGDATRETYQARARRVSGELLAQLAGLVDAVLDGRRAALHAAREGQGGQRRQEGGDELVLLRRRVNEDRDVGVVRVAVAVHLDVPHPEVEHEVREAGGRRADLEAGVFDRGVGADRRVRAGLGRNDQARRGQIGLLGPAGAAVIDDLVLVHLGALALAGHVLCGASACGTEKRSSRAGMVLVGSPVSWRCVAVWRVRRCVLWCRVVAASAFFGQFLCL
ncbi:unnamed protein product [Pelagomonas calceolata]|uniref:Uncharacterized protein n=1 Tax=Pelagomonas calceolata TaxID=35677 RepID=A0A8J2SX31_9STRA|nr:unnamed protein product [Pelagomonas calceolata]|mmetsp:Transcript_11742/g.34666  ORF Transcript_11742/g.34666 Transcript_11742/m.34666 type:complete len:296 (-) Transcript_11742:214-1101(-)